MAKGPQNVKKFLSDLAVKLQPLWAVERYHPYITSSLSGERGAGGGVVKCQVIRTMFMLKKRERPRGVRK